MSVLPITEDPPAPDPCCDLEAHLPALEFPTLLDPALRDDVAVHIRRKEAA